MEIRTKMTMTDAAYSCMEKRKKEIEFVRLWQDVAKAMQIPEEQLARKKRQFYNELMIDTRFAVLHGNKWDLRSRRRFDELHVADADMEDSEEESEEAEEETLDLPKGEEAY